jgi:hypothetical protein
MEIRSAANLMTAKFHRNFTVLVRGCHNCRLFQSTGSEHVRHENAPAAVRMHRRPPARCRRNVLSPVVTGGAFHNKML